MYIFARAHCFVGFNEKSVLANLTSIFEYCKELVVPSVSSLSSVSFIDTLPSDKHTLHDIRFRFKVDNIWTVISTNHLELRPNEVSKYISLEPIVTHGLTIKATIHHTDTVSVIVACSLNPVGLVRFSNALTRVEE